MLAELLESETGEAKTKEEKEFREYLDSFRMDLEGDPAIIKEDFNKMNLFEQIEFSKKNSIQNANTRHLLTKRKLMHKLAQLLYRKDDPSEIYQEELTWRQLAIRQYVDENPELFKDWDTKYIDDLKKHIQRKRIKKSMHVFNINQLFEKQEKFEDF